MALGPELGGSLAQGALSLSRLNAHQLGHSPGEGQEKAKVCAAGAAGPVKRLSSLLLQEGGLGWADF